MCLLFTHIHAKCTSLSHQKKPNVNLMLFILSFFCTLESQLTDLMYHLLASQFVGVHAVLMAPCASPLIYLFFTPHPFPLCLVTTSPHPPSQVPYNLTTYFWISLRCVPPLLLTFFSNGAPLVGPNHLFMSIIIFPSFSTFHSFMHTFSSHRLKVHFWVFLKSPPLSSPSYTFPFFLPHIFIY